MDTDEDGGEIQGGIQVRGRAVVGIMMTVQEAGGKAGGDGGREGGIGGRIERVRKVMKGKREEKNRGRDRVALLMCQSYLSWKLSKVMENSPATIRARKSYVERGLVKKGHFEQLQAFYYPGLPKNVHKCRDLSRIYCTSLNEIKIHKLTPALVDKVTSKKL
jgi:hypothetical protein